MSKNMKVVISPEEIKERVAVLGREITERYKDESLVVVCVLKGGFLFFADLVREIRVEQELEFVRLASYGRGTESGELVFTKDMEISIKDRNVLIVEDIVDTGHSMDFLIRTLEERKPKSLAIAALVDKYERREVDVKVDFPGFHLDKGFIVGYGMDFAERYRELGGIYELVD